MENNNRSDVIIAKKLGGETDPEYGTNILEYTEFIIDDPNDVVRNRSTNSAIKCTEVYQKLKNNYWLLRDSRYYVEGGANSDFDFQIRFTEFGNNNSKSGPIDSVDDSIKGPGVSILTYINEENIESINKSVSYAEAAGFRESADKMVNDLFSEVFGATTEGEGGRSIALPKIEKVFYDSSKTRVSLSSDPDSEEKISAIIPLVIPGSDLYTNKLSLGPLIKSDIFHPGAKCVIELVINYTKESKIYSKSSMFPVFTYTETGINKNEVNLIVDNEIRVYFDRTSEMLCLERLDQSIDEYIIEGCTAKIIL